MLTAHPQRRRQPPLRLLDPLPLDRWIHPSPTHLPLMLEPTEDLRRPPSPPRAQLMPEPTGDPRPPPRMVLFDRSVTIIDELQEFIKETGDLPLDRSIDSALKDLPAREHLPECSSSRSRRLDRAARAQMAIQDENRYRTEALVKLRELKSSRPFSAAVRKEPLPEFIDGDLYRDLLDGIEPCFSPVPEAPPSVTCLSLKISWPPGHLLCGYPSPAFIASCHHCFLVLYVGSYRPWFEQPGFYLVYNALANSVAIVPSLFCKHMFESHCDIGPGVAVLCCGIEEGDYILAELLLCRDVRTLLPTNKATLFIWASSCPRSWVQREVLLPLPTDAAAAAAADADDEKDTTTGTCSFHADMVFAVSFSSICWVDLLTGILVYNHIHSEQFHFIPLPEECVTSLLRNRKGQRLPDTYRSMCCVDRQTLKFVAMDESYSQECPMLTTWTLRRPLSPTNWKWEKDAVSSFCMKDLWDDQVYQEKLLRPLIPSCPVISPLEPGIIYLSVTDYKHNHSHYVLRLNMDRCRIESVYKVPSDKNAITPPPSLFTSEFSSYLNKTRAWELMHGGEEKIADEVESRSNPSTPYTLGVDLGILKLSRRCVISTLVGPCSRKTGQLASSFCPVGLQAALDIAIGYAP